METAWELGVARPLISFDPEAGVLTAQDRGRRVVVTSSRPALNGYQKGCCFYCFAAVTVERGAQAADVDHFFPWSLRGLLLGNVDGVWNLVLACRDCNRGAEGKFDAVPTLELVARLHRRNEFLITSHHPLRETLIAQTGSSEALRASFLQANYAAASSHRVAHWTPSARASAAF